ncbi:MAG: 4Fe-4S double cluster binding domain-containing protein [bacterium]
MVGAEGFRAHPLPATLEEGEVDPRFLAAPFPHKTAATRSGLGWIGKSALLITPQYGPRVRLATILTDMPLDVGTPIEGSRCGDCDLCVRACPASAISGNEWRAGRPREEFYDARACRDMARKLSGEMIGEDVAICGICIAACPVGKEL